MKIIKKLTDKEFKEKIPSGLADAIFGSEKCYYCFCCDGLRQEKHTCNPFYIGQPACDCQQSKKPQGD